MYYSQFYSTDDNTGVKQRSASEVATPTLKAIRACFASVLGRNAYFDVTSRQLRSKSGHGAEGMVLLFVDGHSQFARWQQLNPTGTNGTDPVYNFDWTVKGLRGSDLR